MSKKPVLNTVNQILVLFSLLLKFGLIYSFGQSSTIETLPTISFADTLTFQKIPPTQIGFLLDNEEQFSKEALDTLMFTPLEGRNILQIGQKDFTYWAILKIKNQENHSQIWWLDVPGNYVTAWLINKEEQIKTHYTGNLLSREKKVIPGTFRNFNYIPLIIPSQSSILVKLKVKTTTYFPIYKDAINVGQPLYFKNFQNQRKGNTSFLDGIYSSLLIICCLYFLVYLLFTKEIFALWIICFCLSLIGYFYQFNSTWYRLGVSPVFVQLAGIILMNLSLLFSYLFVRKYFNLKSLYPFWFKLFTIFTYGILIFSTLHAIYYYWSQNYLYTLFSIVTIHSICYLPMILLGIKILMQPKLFNKILAIGILFCYLVLLYNNVQLTGLNDSLLKLGVAVYCISILVSFSLRAAELQQQRVQVKAERLLDQIKFEELKKLDGLKSNFFANVAHELRTPLTLIVGPINSVLKSENLANRDFTLLKRAQQSGKDLLKLVAAILDLSKMESGKMELTEVPTLLFPFFRRMIAAFETNASNKNIQLNYNYSAAKPLQLAIDKDKLEIIINNLLSNALKFTPKNGAITIEILDLESKMQLSVKDTGRGIHPDDLPNIFNRFYQSKQPNAVLEGGTGIGLSLSQELVKVMNGKIWVETELGVGSTFFVEFPRRETFGEVLEKEVNPMVHPASIREKTSLSTVVLENSKDKPDLLIVEDNDALRAYLITILTPYYTIQTASDGQEAWTLLTTRFATSDTEEAIRLPRLIISDVMMPRMDGFQLLEAIKAKEILRPIPIIMLTARVAKEDKLKALRIGVDDYILKPFEEEELLVRIENLLRNAQERKVYVTLEKEGKTTKEPAPTISKEAIKWLETVENLSQKYFADVQFSIPRMASTLAMSERSLQRQLKKLTGLTPNQYLHEIRLQEARKLLENKEFDTVNKVAYAVGFSDAKNFSRRFKQRFGKTPSAY